MDISRIVAGLPADIRDSVQAVSNPALLSRLSHSLLDSTRTDSLLPLLEPLLPELVARWTSRDGDRAGVIAALGKIVPLQPQLLPQAQVYLRRQQADRSLWTSYADDALISLTLGLYRLCLQDVDCMTCFIKPADLLFGLQHSCAVVRFLVIRVLCLYLHAADAAIQELVRKYVGDGPILGRWEQIEIDYRFFTLWENKRRRDVEMALELASEVRAADASAAEPQTPMLEDADLTGSVQVSGRLIPAPKRQPMSSSGVAQFIETPTSRSNMQTFVDALYSKKPVLLHGTSGSGKTTMVNHLASRLGKLDTMITLQLNEQSDMKILLGLYTSGQEPGTFVWKPGVLTTAVREGRWVFVEDLDRAPNEVISALLPLVENNTLLLPGRAESIKAAAGFKLIATMRPSKTSNTRQGLNFIGRRFWTLCPVKELEDAEICSIVRSIYPALAARTDELVDVFVKVRAIAQTQAFRVKVNSSSARPVTARDLIKWCRRISGLFTSQAFTEQTMDAIFLDAVDCFAGYLPAGEAYQSVVSCVAQHLHIDPDRRDHVLQARNIRLGLREPGSKTVQIGRVTLSRDPLSRKRTVSSRFSTNPHTARVLEKVASAVKCKEPLLLVGETGTGKTTTVQYLATLLGKRLVPFNLSQQSESSDLLGGFRPVDTRAVVMQIQDEFEQLFLVSFSSRDNSQYVDLLNKSIAKSQWKRVCKLWRGAVNEVKKRMLHDGDDADEHTHPSKKQRLMQTNGTAANENKKSHTQMRWRKLIDDIDSFEARLSSSGTTFAFSFVEGNIVKAARNGDWILLDEINLAAPDTLEALADLLNHDDNGGPPSILLTEAGKVERIVAHPEFRVFAAMNPATDVGKRDLPAGIRSRFTELYVESPDADVQSLQHIVHTYLGDGLVEKSIVAEVAQLHMKIQDLSRSNRLVDGSGQQPHFSLRTLTRSLVFARDITPFCGLRRGLFEGFSMSYLTFLDHASEELLLPLLHAHIFSTSLKAKGELHKPLRKPDDGRQYISYRHFWLRQGSVQPQPQPHYIITPFVERNLDNLVRAIFSRRAPVLIQGPTSSGKTSMIEFLAKMSGNKFVRINNHEHTDLQEYLGTYISDANGVLKFQEGILVEALRKGYWIVLDELNLAPSDVLEALNRLLDDNRELLIPETQETVKPHADFMLFATQNPAGLYGGRKPLSRAFRNRFLELHFDDIPVDELCEILHQRTEIPESWSRRIVEAYKELSALRQVSRLFESKSFATLRDLFRWALRRADSVEQLAINGYMLLAERVRNADEREKVKEVIEAVMSRRGPRVRIDTSSLYASGNSPEIAAYNVHVQTSDHSVVWTKAMRRLYVLVAHALRNNEPVLLVGETGCGKTTVCQMLAQAVKKTLHIVNAHQNTETGDLIGSQRPIRNRFAVEAETRALLARMLNLSEQAIADMNTDDLLARYDSSSSAAFDDADVSRLRELTRRSSSLFEWTDGSLVKAMKNGDFFLLDEISLADDSVLERLNSVLEPSRSLFLAEKGPNDSDVTALDGFQFFATMNPGGDYGKRELSPALRNRFTEIWVPAIEDVEDVQDIVSTRLPSAPAVSNAIVAFASWYSQAFVKSVKASISIRDVLACVDFLRQSSELDSPLMLMHAISMVFVDSLGANPAGLLSITHSSLAEQRARCIQKLEELSSSSLMHYYSTVPELLKSDSVLQIGDFALPRSEQATADSSFTLLAPTTRVNAMRIVRALQIPKPLLIEGDPGVGKTTIVSSLAGLVGNKLTRINLSEQTDLMDLFGTDVPVEGAAAGVFTWQDAPFLTAMKHGGWVLLDEMNLASQSILEGLNACLDHRGEVYISELDQTFHRHADFRLFAAQNPHHQGGGRKGLPASFVNRFTVVYADPFSHNDSTIICKHLYPDIESQVIEQLTSFVTALNHKATQGHAFGVLGSPLEFNLRDTLRWLQLSSTSNGILSLEKAASSFDLSDIVFGQRFRSVTDQTIWRKMFTEHFRQDAESRSFFHVTTNRLAQVGLGTAKRAEVLQPRAPEFQVSAGQLPVLESLMLCIQLRWPVILVGSSGAGKTSLLRHAAAIHGAKLTVMTMNADIDATDLVGGLEQADHARLVIGYLARLRGLAQHRSIAACQDQSPQQMTNYATLLACLDRLDMTSPADVLAECIASLKNFDTVGKDVLKLVHEGELLQAGSALPERAKFEWVDGILVQALLNGDWLVLDNANLSSSSVLDRLNSLLEPNGSLILSEHPLSNGDARLIKPHPQFRIFLTMDPKHGELSRAMRNRALELYLFSHDEERIFAHERVADPAVGRFDQIVRVITDTSLLPSHTSHVVQRALEQLTEDDLQLLPAFQDQVISGLLGSADIMLLNTEITRICQNSVYTQWRNWFRQRTELLTLSALSTKELVTLNPLNNVLVLRSESTSISLASHYSRIGDAIHRQFALDRLISELPDIQINGNRTETLTKRISSLRNSVNDYLSGQLQLVNNFFTFLLSHASDPQTVPELDAFERLQMRWAHLASKICQPEVSDADIQITLQLVHVALAENLKHDDLITSSFAAHQYEKLSTLLNLDVKSGWFMEALWKAFEPTIAPTYSAFLQLESLQRLADDFDHHRWSSSVDLASIVEARAAFSKVAAVLKEQGSDQDTRHLLDNTDQAVRHLRDVEYDPEGSRRPYFQAEFEAVHSRIELLQAARQDGLSNTTDLHNVISVLAGKPTRELMIQAGERNPRAVLLTRLWQSRKLNVNIKQDENETPISILDKVRKCHNVSLRNLALLREELQTLGQLYARNAQELCGRQDDELFEVLKQVKAAVQDATDKSSVDLPAAARAELMRYLQSLQRICNAVEPPSQPDLALSYINLAIAGILSYVPKVLIDPLARTHLAEAMNWAEYCYWDERSSAFLHFDQQFDGCESLRTRETLQRRATLGDVKPPSATGVVQRPTVTLINELQQQFDQVLRVVRVLASRFVKGDFDDAATSESLRHILERLQTRYQAYADITLPVIGFLTMLILGLDLYMQTRKSTTEDAQSHLFAMLLKQGKPTGLEELRRLSLLFNIHKQSSQEEQSAIEHIMSSQYGEWKQHVQSAQEQNSLRSNLYTFKGSYSDEEDEDDREFEELFPDDSDTPIHDSIDHHNSETAVVVAELHHALHVSNSSSGPGLVDFIKSVSTTNAGQVAVNQVPTLLLHINDTLEQLQESSTSKELYNIYKDPNISEATRLLSLIRKIQARFRAIQETWPEHATLAEVLKLSTEVLDFSHTTPIMKLLTKCEKVHETIYEWQKVASKEFSAAPLYDELTTMLVSWRRLELSTWLRLFDTEVQNCVAEAKSWWYIAYESIVAASESLAEDDSGNSLSIHALHVIITLEQFIRNTSVGQYTARLELLEVFARDLGRRSSRTPRLGVVYQALANFVSYYKRFSSVIGSHISTERAKLERGVKEVVQLASWKDTNIDALRQSAKTSHRKLFKVVRKFRSLLRQSSSPFIDRGPPDGVLLKAEEADFIKPNCEVSDIALRRLRDKTELHENWPTRFIRVSSTVDLMRKLTEEPNVVHSTGAARISDFIANLETSISELRKATPSLLTDDNKDLVKHLKVQKRSLFAETLKEMRHMGLQYNLASGQLDRQSTMAKVIVAMPSAVAPDSSMEASHYYFHKLLALMERVRGVQKEHSGDLTPAEVSRSTGYLEALWQKTIQQRTRIIDRLVVLSKFRAAVRQVTNITDTIKAGDQISSAISKSGTSDLDEVAIKHAAQRLVHACEASIVLIRAQSSFGGQDGNALLAMLRRWIYIFTELIATLGSIGALPSNLTSVLRRTKHEQAINRIAEFNREVEQTSLSSTAFQPILVSLQALATLHPFAELAMNGNAKSASFADIRDALFSILDTVLVQVQTIESVKDKLPADSGVPSWYVQEDTLRSTMFSTAKIEQISQELDDILRKLHFLDAEELNLATLTIASLSPLLQEFDHVIGRGTQRYLALHESTARLNYTLGSVFVTLGKSGFCTPPDKSAGGDAGNEKLEGGTGLGDGEGAEDISKDIGDDEDLTELAEQKEDSSERKDMADEPDAVDMADADLQGQEDEVEEKEDDDADAKSGDESEPEDMDDEVGDVDDLGPSAVDEKMWDDGGKENEKEKEGENGKGTKNEEQVAADQSADKQDKQEDADGDDGNEEDEGEAEVEMPADESDAVAPEKSEKLDQHLDEGENLDLPDEMNIDGHSQAGSNNDDDNDIDEMNDMDDAAQDDGMSEVDMSEDLGSDAEQDIGEDKDDQDVPGDENAMAEDGADDDEGQEGEDGVQDAEEEHAMNQDQSLRADDNNQAADDAAPSEQEGSGLEADDKSKTDQEAASSAENNQGAEGEERGAPTSGNRGSGEDDGSKDAVGRADGHGDEQSQPFKKLGDVLEQWYNQQKSIRAALETIAPRKTDADADMKDVDFEHLADDAAEAEAQALGTATQEQASALDQENAVPVDEDKQVPPVDEDQHEAQPDPMDEEATADAKVTNNKLEGQPNAFIGEQRSQQRSEEDSLAADVAMEEEDVELDIANISINPSDDHEQSHEHAQAVWLKHELATRTLAATLSEQLRLVLAPTLTTKLRGDFRTGKRLNIKRIIPYIASSYKRDKIWMRRSIPSKRSYQIMIALDNSKSMADASEGDSNKIDLAFQTLALIAKSLSMLEAGDLCCLGFGQDIKNAHAFGTPFTDDAGAKIFQMFDFQQDKTDVRKLIAEALDLFRNARSSSQGAAAELWQLMLIISDGVCEDHATVTQLVRQAQEERIMVVFVIVDQNTSPADGKAQSIMDLQSAEFKVGADGEMNVVRTKYMDSFPFRWFIVVRDIRELPVVLATALRQWFSEVVDSSG